MRARPPLFRLAAVAVAGCVAAPHAMWAQASRYVPLDHRVAPYVEHLIRAGVIADPSPLSRPLKASHVLEALRQVERGGLPASTGRTIAWIEAQLARTERPAHLGYEFFVGGGAGTYARRDALRELGNEFASPTAGGAVASSLGPVIVALRGGLDLRQWEDPDYTGDTTWNNTGRMTDAYLGVQGRYGELFFGAVSRNWGPPGVPSVLLSDVPYSYDHLYLRVGTRRAYIEGLATELDFHRNLEGDRVRRFWGASRAVVEFSDRVAATFGQGKLTAGVGRGFEPWWLNPLKLSRVAGLDESDEDSTNSLYMAELSFEWPRGVRMQGSLLIDDLASLWSTSDAPDRIAAIGVMDVALGRLAARGYAAVVTSVAYRSPGGPDQSLIRRGVGLAHNFADYVQLTAELSWMPNALVLLRPQVTWLNQGEGDFRQPWPEAGADHPTLFEGTVERTWRFGTEAFVTAGAWTVDLDAGLHLITNAGHVSGNSSTRFVGRIGVTYTVAGSIALP